MVSKKSKKVDEIGLENWRWMDTIILKQTAAKKKKF